ncbi:cytochrome P450 [Mycobacterium sp. E2733]|uniref:cytochrome P450 n=1 Tax=Mycobacterium sp. E2733 TaxID=1834138 RepID=UPI0009ED241A|nr:cytochrome P450 [Mycobacterium sp. E2733]
MLRTQHTTRDAAPDQLGLGQMLRLAWTLPRRGDDAFDELFDRHGDVVWLSPPPPISRLVGSRVAFVRDPALIKPLFTSPADEVNAPEPHRVMDPFWGDRSVFMLDGPDHRRLRKLMLPRLRGDALTQWREFIVARTEQEVRGWTDQQSVAVHPRLLDVSLELILKVVASVPDSALPRWKSAWRDLLTTVASGQSAMRSALRSFGALRWWPRYQRELNRCDELVYDEIGRRRRRHPELRHDDVVDSLLHAHGEPLSDREIRDQVVGIMLGGYDPPATLASWAIERLVRSPHALAAATTEVRGGGGQLTYLDAVVQESLRLRPPFMLVARFIPRPLSLGGRYFPGGTTVMAVVQSVHRHPDLYDDPKAFRPERFLEQRPGSYQLIPFGGGEHRCLGDRLAVFEATHMLATVLRSVNLTAVDPRDEPIRVEMGLVPGKGATVRATRPG